MFRSNIYDSKGGVANGHSSFRLLSTRCRFSLSDQRYGNPARAPDILYVYFLYDGGTAAESDAVQWSCTIIIDGCELCQMAQSPRC